MKAEKLKKLEKLLDKRKHIEWDLDGARCVLFHGGPYSIQGNMCSADIPDEYAKTMLKAQINNLTQQLAEIDQELEEL